MKTTYGILCGLKYIRLKIPRPFVARKYTLALSGNLS